MTEYSSPLTDKKLEAIAQILAADIDDPLATITRARDYVSRGPDGPLNMLQIAIRVTLADELAEDLQRLATICGITDPLPGNLWHRTFDLLARFKEIS
jgi:hypothetical protein